MSGRGHPSRNPIRATLLALRYHIDHAADEVAKAIRHDADGEELAVASPTRTDPTRGAEASLGRRFERCVCRVELSESSCVQRLDVRL